MTRIQIDDFINRIKALAGYSILQSIIEENENNFFISGGALRNFLISSDASVKDLDIFYTGTLNHEALDLLTYNGLVTQTPFGSVRWYPERSDVYYDLVSFNEVKLISPVYKIEEVLEQFDITVNAIAVDLKSKQFYNPIDGLADITNKVIRAVRFDFPDSVISKHCPISLLSTLWFRIIHFSSTLKFEIESNTKDWLIANMFRKQDLQIFQRHFFSPVLTSLYSLQRE